MGGKRATLEELMQQPDIVIATTGVKGLIKPEMVRKGQIIFALSNPEPEIEPLVARSGAASPPTARASTTCGLSRPLQGRARGACHAFTDAMLIAAAEAIAGVASGDELVLDPLDKELHQKCHRPRFRAAAAPVRLNRRPTPPDYRDPHANDKGSSELKQPREAAGRHLRSC